jgi:hypothetical protein
MWLCAGCSQKLPFLRRRITYADLQVLIETAMGPSGVNTDVVFGYLKTDVAPTLGANAGLWILSLIFILIFVLW